MSQPEFRSNIAQWKAMQDNGYFDNHPLYRDLIDNAVFDCAMIERFVPLSGVGDVVVIGCGYGRESVHIARRVGHVFGIDVSEKILDRAVKHTRDNGVTNFTPVLAERFAETIPQGVDLVFSHVVFQHLTRDLARRYLSVLADKLAPGGAMVIQFCEDFAVDRINDAALEVYEPSVSYDLRQIIEASGPRLKLMSAQSSLVTPTALWHWVHLAADPAYYRQPPAIKEWTAMGASIDLKQNYQFYASPLPDAGAPGAVFSSGSQPWGYAASIAFAAEGAAPALDLQVMIESRDDTVYLLIVDKDYVQQGARVEVPPGYGSRSFVLPLSAEGAILVVQAGGTPQNKPVVLHSVTPRYQAA